MGRNDNRSDAEKDAAAAKLLAEAARADAEAAKYRAEARTAEATALMRELEAAEKARENANKLARDDYHHVYRFNEVVGKASVDRAVTRLTEWHRQEPGCDIEVIFNSPGGEIMEGFVLFDHLTWLGRQGHKIITGATGRAASMAGILVQAGNYRWSSPESWYLIHRASFGVGGSTYEVEDQVEFIKNIEKRIIAIFVARSNLTAATIKRKWERKNWWLDADEALRLGLFDEIRGFNPPDPT